jgi:hypothetical protein
VVGALYGFPECDLDYWLFWSSEGPDHLRRRQDVEARALYPSWLWAGWVGGISFFVNEALHKPCKALSDPIEWWQLESIGAQPVPIQMQPDTRRFDSVGLTLDEPPLIEPELELSKDLGFPFLQFRTRTTSYLVSPFADEPPNWMSALPLRAAGALRVNARNDNDNIAGAVRLDSNAHERLTVKFSMSRPHLIGLINSHTGY